MIIRKLEHDDIDDLVELCRSQVTETLPHMPFEEDVVRFYASQSIDTPGHFMTIFVCVTEDGRIIGYLVAHFAPYLFCRQFTAEQEVIYVLPEYRGSRAAMMLMSHFERWARMKGALEVYAGVANGFNAERTTKFFEKLGFTDVGHYLRKVNPQNEVLPGP